MNIKTRLLFSALAFSVSVVSLFAGNIAQSDDGGFVPPSSFGYKALPSVNISQNANVGSIPTMTEVSAMGTAVCNMPIDVPAGPAGLKPQMTLAYNGQIGIGIAGRGFEVTGISAITRGSRDIFHDGKAFGVEYSDDDAFYLDGKRLYLTTSSNGERVYNPEGDVNTFVYLRHNADNNSVVTFEIKTSDGKTCTFGSTTNSRNDVAGSSGMIKTSCWYIDRSVDRCGNIITYTYTKDNLHVYPSRIEYGDNKKKNSPIKNSVEFHYGRLSDVEAVPYRLCGKQAYIALILDGIETKTADKIFRRYNFTYEPNTVNEMSRRLSQVSVSNGNGETLPSTVITWNAIPPNYEASDIKMQLMSETRDLTLSDRMYQALDINSDGYTDILEIANATEKGGEKPGINSYTYLNFYINEAKHGSATPEIYLRKTIKASPSIQKPWTSFWKMPATIDYDGDGLADFVMPDIEDVKDQNGVIWWIIPGSNLANNNWDGILVSVASQCSGSKNLFSYGDFNNDGRTEILQMEHISNSGNTPCHLVRYPGAYTPGTNPVTDFQLNLTSEPKAIYVADFNGNGMEDLLVICKNGYSIFWNTCDSIPFNNSKKTNSSGLKYVTNMSLGDFNGDGMPDLIMNQDGESNYNIAFGNGDGTFSIGQPFYPSVASKNADGTGVRYTMEVIDLDHDGRSDIVLGMPNARATSQNDFVWLYSNGKTMIEKRHVTTSGEDDSKWFNTITGHFTGKGALEVIHFGSNLLTGDVSGSNEAKARRIYYDSSLNVGAGLVNTITDGMGNYSKFTYSNMFDKETYSNSKQSVWPNVNIQLPGAIVMKLTKSNGVSGESEETYKYFNMQFGVTGRGLLPFEKTVIYKNTAETTTTTEIKKWDSDLLLPITTTTKVEASGWSQSTCNEKTLAKKENGNYLLLGAKVSEEKSDGSWCDVEYHYDETHGYLLSSGKYYDDNILDTLKYDGYECLGGTWLPTKILHVTKHPDEWQYHVTNTEIEYNNIGLPVLTTSNVGTGRETSKRTTYDVWGNVVSETIETYGANAVENVNVFDESGRYKVRESTSPSSVTMSYEHDTWGNIVTASDVTDPSHPLTTTYHYDNWGRNVCTTSPRGVRSATYYCQSDDGEYAIVEMGDGKPWNVTWYDAMKRKLKEQTIGIGEQTVTKTYGYDKNGNVVSASVENGRFRHSEQMKYGSMNRITSWTDNSGRKLGFSYGKRQSSFNFNGRRYSRTYDSWGNVLKATDPLCTINNRFFSSGKLRQSGVSPFVSTMEYDANGYQTSLTDPDAGTTSYEYNGLGQLLRQTDARGVESVNAYDEINRLVSTTIDGVKTTYEYGNSGNAANLSVKEQMGNMTAEREYNEYGEVVKEMRNANGKRMTFTFAYDSLGRVSEQTFPNGLRLKYVYDCYGNKIQTLRGTANVWKFLSFDGLVRKEQLGNNFIRTTTMDENGYLSSVRLEKGDNLLHEMIYDYDPITGNLMSRKGMEEEGTTERFTYDKLDRLTSYTEQDHFVREMEYDKHGRILYKYGVGNYDLGNGHRVSLVTNELDSITGYPQRILYNGFGKVAQITGINGTFDISYGPDMERWIAVDERERTTTYFFGDYEHTEMPSDYLDVCYLDGGVLYISSRNSADICVPFLDNLGSYVKIYNPSGSELFHATYDPWGKPTYLRNDIGFRRGYCGHEMMDGGWLVNMNGRVYDPWLATFLSPDNYIQDPLNSQNYNRYGYCVNNPLKYTDPTGNSFTIFFGFALFNVASNMTIASMNGQNMWKAAARSALMSFATYGIGQAFGGVGSVVNEALRAGAHGLVGGVSNVIGGGSFGSGFLSGSLSSGIGSYTSSLHLGLLGMSASSTVVGGISAWASGGDILSGALQGLAVGLLNHGLHDSKNVMGCSARCERDVDGVTRVAPESLDLLVVYGDNAVKPAYEMSYSSRLGLSSSVLSIANNKWKSLSSSTKSRYVQKCRVMARDKFNYRIPQKNSDLYRNIIPSELTRWSKGLGYAGFGANLLENMYSIRESGYVGLGNVVDIGLSAVSLNPVLGIPLEIGYIGADYLWQQYSGYTIRQSLNNIYYKNIW